MPLAPKDYVHSPEALERSYTKAEAEQYTRWLATHHYENFHVVTFLLPKRLHQDFHNVYSFCRWADDLGDEIGDPTESLRLLAWWRKELLAMYAGQVQHPVFVALEGTAGSRPNMTYISAKPTIEMKNANPRSVKRIANPRRAMESV